MDAHEALYSQLKTLFDADTGTGGLSNSASTGYVRHFVRAGDPSIGEDRTGSWPKIIVEISSADDSTFNHTHFNGVVRMHVFTRRDEGFATMDAVNERIATVYDEVALGATTSPWNFSVFLKLRSFKGPDTSSEMHYIHEFSAVGCSG